MKKIGYIYKYNPSEGMGILVFGDWKIQRLWGSSTIKNNPILFSDKDLLSDISTGQLVYFDLDGHNVSNIERASLSNFRVDYINSIIRCGENEYEHSFYNANTIISFECLDNIDIPTKDKCKSEHITADEELLSTDIIEDEDDINGDLDFLDLDLFFDKDDSPYPVSANSVGSDIINKSTANLPESITDLFNLFGKYNHWSRRDSMSLNVFDLSFWVDSDVLDSDYYGKRVNELKFIYDVFVLKKHYDSKGREINTNINNDCISSTWSLLLSKFSDNDLEKILYIAPKLQPALPISFCKKNARLLSDDYGMPDVEICKLQCLCKISNARTISDYKNLKDKLFVYRHCTAKHLEGEGTPMCKMGKRCIMHLEKRLEKRYETVIKQEIIAQIKVLSEEANIENELQSLTHYEFDNVGLFLEHYNNLRYHFLDYNVCKTVKNSFDELPQLIKEALKSSLSDCFNESAIIATKSDDLTPGSIGYTVEQLGDWILDSTKQKIKELVNERFSNLDNLEDLNYAYIYEYITAKQYFDKYTQLTSDYNAYQFLQELSNYSIAKFPLTIQWYLVSKIIKLLGYSSLNSYNYVKLDYFESISDIRSLLAWLKQYGRLNDIVLNKAEERICSVLSNGERWTLFEEKLIKTPGDENIRKILDEAYKKKFIKQDLLKYTCFQDIMCADIYTVKDSEVLLFIADNLDNEHQYLMQRKTEGFLKLYLWQKQPSDSFNWDLIKSHYHELPVHAQIRTLRYIFGRISSGDSSLSLDTLYSEFVETSTPASSAICGILYLLKAKKNNVNVSITPSMVESVIGEDLVRRFNFLKESKEFFYPCIGYLAISQEKIDTEYLSFYGILTKEIKDDASYYVITFYDSPVNLFWGTIEWPSPEYIYIAQQVLLRNTSVEIVGDKYYIPESQELFVKQYVMSYGIDDRCGLLCGYLPRLLKKYEDSDNYICRCECFEDSDPNNGIPFFWCQKKICARRAHFLLPPTQWEKYRFADLLYIATGQKSDEIETIWRVNAEISQFICDYPQTFKSDERNISSAPLNEDEERGVWDNESSTYRTIYDECEDDEYEYVEDEYDNREDDYFSENDEPTYDRYNGSYAQDVMGYSDDEIDAIFGGEPDAYWNID